MVDICLYLSDILYIFWTSFFFRLLHFLEFWGEWNLKNYLQHFFKCIYLSMNSLNMYLLKIFVLIFLKYISPERSFFNFSTLNHCLFASYFSFEPQPYLIFYFFLVFNSLYYEASKHDIFLLSFWLNMCFASFHQFYKMLEIFDS